MCVRACVLWSSGVSQGDSQSNEEQNHSLLEVLPGGGSCGRPSASMAPYGHGQQSGKRSCSNVIVYAECEFVNGFLLSGITLRHQKGSMGIWDPSVHERMCLEQNGQGGDRGYGGLFSRHLARSLIGMWIDFFMRASTVPQESSHLSMPSLHKTTHIHTYIHTYIMHTYIRTYVHTYIHTYIHT